MMNIEALEKVILKMLVSNSQFEEYKKLLCEKNKEIKLLRRQEKWDSYPIQTMELMEIEK